MSSGNKLTVLILAILLPGIVFASNTKPRHDLKSKVWTNKYDTHFRKYSKRYFGAGFNWHWFKSQGIAESGLRNTVKSKSGAVGIMQILPSTYADIHKKSAYLSSGRLTEPRWNIASGIFYDRILYNRWKKKLKQSSSENDLYMAFASYNAGHGKISRVLKKKEKQLGRVNSWAELEQHVPSETRHYVRRIKFLMGK